MRVSYCLQSDQRNVGVAGRDPFIGENLRFYTIDSPASAKNLGVNRVSWRRHQLGTSDRHRSAGITVPCKLGTCAHRNSSDSSMLAQSRPIWVPLHCSCVAGICFPSWLWQEMETQLKTDAMLITKKIRVLRPHQILIWCYQKHPCIGFAFSKVISLCVIKITKILK